MKRISYHVGRYVSHKRAGEDYIAALASVGIGCVADPETADVLILHDEPMALAEIIPRYGDKYRIAYSVWETDRLCDAYVQALRGVDRVWTCSPFSAAAFAKAGFAVDVVPHVVRVEPPTADDLDDIKARIAYDPDTFYFYTIVDSVNPRKNLEALLQTFVATFAKMEKVKLIVKQYRNAWDLAGLPHIVSLDAFLPRGGMAALHTLLDCYVSAHRAEAWGLSLSDAMYCGKPVIATGFSGNMFYMNRENSFPADYNLVPVSERMCGCIPLYTRDMLWAEIDRRHLAYLLRKVLRRKYAPGLPVRARQDMERFGPLPIGERMRELLEGV
ncbi:glycosyl transferase group 1 [Solidesulfovibrio fructosivorans JJ]]|uniref:Glycosyl transferase group 1 n=1 Tax=Solidesulfovibrio fructosivorans JJ] TaxID=596151 RepID=E1JWA7_SOLFR|nr:glycosyltransferase [Solidesulfovibrio fructosivorans]EFL51467.1 glycosyl transferase group 1 [Solidesulfovibrio fructosivorans JJ]]